MTVLRWIAGVILMLFVAGWIGTVLLYVLRDDDRLQELGRRLRQYSYLIALFWFNLEIWGRVAWTLISWK